MNSLKAWSFQLVKQWAVKGWRIRYTIKRDRERIGGSLNTTRLRHCPWTGWWALPTGHVNEKTTDDRDAAEHQTHDSPTPDSE
ncbi:hypothetical protein N7537_007878 [Penicillium hordei]|uniref:Uncharacterized protein n=1 Tax=Penicillium hordei TaxID=40994 RepID=A0AAD6DZW0_9EURO|nr:uncharacterized protein N7537_007878 [Penicillium hordei]KAJ5597794.1 hypothetical protein N7537_007878 [Penicillium hordei]